MSDYKIFQSEYIVSNQQDFINQCLEVQNIFKDQDTTKNYYKYNIFSVTAGSIYFYNLYLMLRIERSYFE